MPSSDKFNGVLIQILNELKEIKSDYKEFKDSQQKQCLEFQAIFEELKKDNCTLKRTVNDLLVKNSKLETKIFSLETGLNNILQDKLVKNMIISGIPEEDGEDLNKILRKVCSKLQVNIDDSKYKVRRLFTRKSNKNTNLLVEFDNINIKTALFKQLKELTLSKSQIGFNSNSDSPIMFFHQLTSTFLNILGEARKLKESHHFKYVWYQNSQILIKRQNESKIYSIKSLKDLTDVVNLITSDEGLKTEPFIDSKEVIPNQNYKRTTRNNGRTPA